MKSIEIPSLGEISGILTGMLVVGLLAGVTTHSLIARENDQSVAHAAVVELDASDEEEILWFARAIYSETKRYDEQVLVAWVIRNRVETGYYGDTYEDVTRAPHQFSGLNPGDSLYDYNISRSRDYESDSWVNAMRVAQAVYTAPRTLRPFPTTVRHFYSPISVTYTPKWAQSKEAAFTITDTRTGGVRFAFYDGV